MLKLKVKLNTKNITREELVWREKYLSPNLSYITGVTSPSYNLGKYDKLASTNSITNTDSSLNVESENVLRQGYVIVKSKVYDAHRGRYTDYSVADSGTTTTYHYVVNKDKYFYWNNGKYTFDNLLHVSSNTITEDYTYECDENTKELKIDTLYWIEDEKVNIDGNTYIYDRHEGKDGGLKYLDDGDILDSSAITRCDGIEFHPYPSPKDYEEVTKFRLTKQDMQEETYSRLSFARYYY